MRSNHSNMINYHLISFFISRLIVVTVNIADVAIVTFMRLQSVCTPAWEPATLSPHSYKQLIQLTINVTKLQFIHRVGQKTAWF